MRKVSVTGEQGVGIYAADSSIAKNTGTIEIGTKGTGIYAENDLKVNGNKTAISTNKDINVTNTGTIEAKRIQVEFMESTRKMIKQIILMLPPQSHIVET